MHNQEGASPDGDKIGAMRAAAASFRKSAISQLKAKEKKEAAAARREKARVEGLRDAPERERRTRGVNYDTAAATAAGLLAGIDKAINAHTGHLRKAETHRIFDNPELQPTKAAVKMLGELLPELKLAGAGLGHKNREVRSQALQKIKELATLLSVSPNLMNPSQPEVLARLPDAASFRGRAIPRGARPR
jgi:hypothetical protein